MESQQGTEKDRFSKVIAFFAKAAGNDSRITAQCVDMMLDAANGDVIHSSRALDQLTMLKSKIDFLQMVERNDKAHLALLNDLPGAEIDENQAEKSKEYVADFINALGIVDTPTEIHKAKVQQIDNLINVVMNRDQQGNQFNKNNLLCPISHKIMKIPVKNIVCGHAYDRESLDAFIESRRNQNQPVRFDL